jgi:hypothetical protein
MQTKYGYLAESIGKDTSDHEKCWLTNLMKCIIIENLNLKGLGEGGWGRG